MIDNALKIAQQIRSGECSATEVLQATLARIARHDGELNCFTHITNARAQQEAAVVDTARQKKLPLGPLAGVPYAVKNLFDIRQVVTTAGAKINLRNPPALVDALLVQRLQQAGAILIGALNMDEHAYGFTTENHHFGVTRNPHDLRCIAGGSSGGSAAAVAATLVPLTLGSDTNGSIRVPASLCGIFGLKPTYGRLPRTGTFPFVHSLDHLGPFAGSAADLAAAYNVLQGGDLQDVACAQRAIEIVTVDKGGKQPWRVGVLGGWFHDWAGERARAAVNQVATALGAHDEVILNGAERARSAAFLITGAEAGALHRQTLISDYDDYEPLSRDRLVAGSLIPATWVVQAQRLRRQVYEEALALFDQYDILLAPATPLPATPIGAETMVIQGKTVGVRANIGIMKQPISCLGLPVCTVPVWPALGADPQLPIGVQLIAAPWREEVCLQAAAYLEAVGIVGTRTPTLMTTPKIEMV